MQGKCPAPMFMLISSLVPHFPLPILLFCPGLCHPAWISGSSGPMSIVRMELSVWSSVWDPFFPGHQYWFMTYDLVPPETKIIPGYFVFIYLQFGSTKKTKICIQISSTKLKKKSLVTLYVSLQLWFHQNQRLSLITLDLFTYNLVFTKKQRSSLITWYLFAYNLVSPKTKLISGDFGSIYLQLGSTRNKDYSWLLWIYLFTIWFHKNKTRIILGYLYLPTYNLDNPWLFYIRFFPTWFYQTQRPSLATWHLFVYSLVLPKTKIFYLVCLKSTWAGLAQDRPSVLTPLTSGGLCAQ